MKKISALLEKYLTPIGAKLAANRFLSVITHAMIGILPLTIAGSLALIIQYFPFIDTVVPADAMNAILSFLGVVSDASLSMIALFLAGLIGYYYMKDEKGEPIFGAIISISSFLIVTPFFYDKDFVGFIPMQWLGGQGMFAAMIIGLASSVIFNKLMKSKATIKLPDSVPPMVAEPFRDIVPAIVTFVVFAAIRYGFSFTSYGDLHNAVFTLLQQPLLMLGTTLPATIVIVIFIQLLWFMGLHGQNIVGAVMNPIWVSAMIANLEATTAGKAPEYIFTSTFFTAFVFMQFISLVIACVIGAKSAQLKAVGKISLGSSIFNISEPIVFGAPVVLNVLLVIPWILVMIIFVVITWLAMETGFSPLTNGADIPWTTPPIISGYLVTGSFAGALVQIINIIIGVIIYLPFVKVYDKQLLQQEQINEENQKNAIDDTYTAN